MAFGRTTSARPRARAAVALAAAGGLLVLALAPVTASAATSPPAQPAPDAGQTTTVTWTGSIPGATTAQSAACPANALSDSTSVTITVPTGFYDATKMRADWSISWSDPNLVNDEKLTVVPPGSGTTKNADEINDSEATQHEDISYDNPAGGAWTVRACAFTSGPQAYTGKLVLTSSALTAGSPSPTASPEPTATATTAGGAASNRTFDEPVVVDSDDLNSVAEPSLRIAADGAIYVSGPQGLGGARVPAAAPGTGAVPGTGGDLVWRSDDGGKTFGFLGSYDGTLGGGDSDITSAPNGALYASGLNGACIAVSASTDRGNSWTTNPAGCADGAGSADRQWNDVDGNDAVYTGYGTLSRGLVIHKSVITGPVVVNGPATVVNSGDYQWPGVVDVNPTNGNAVMAWNTSTNDEIQINGVTRAGALMFPSPKRVAVAGGDTFDSFVSIDHGKDGTLYAVWSERRPAVKETWTMLAASRDGGTTWDAPVHVDSTPSTTVFPWVTAGDAGRVAVSYYGTDSTGISPEALDVKDASWHVWSSFSDDYGQTFAEHRTSPTMHQGSICTSGTGCATGTRDLLDFFETDLDANGCLVTAYTDNSRDTVAPDGSRTSDQATRIDVVRQSGGDGLLAARPCGAAALPIVPEAPVATLLPLLAAGLVGMVVYRRRRLART
ncbi:MAG: hypothetical protein JWP11_3444 [Frankiales bacterium]|nr:hypothetical protein [Frankiales bacterium]